MVYRVFITLDNLLAYRDSVVSIRLRVNGITPTLSLIELIEA